MALTQSAWTVSTLGEGAKKTLVASCTVTATTAENDAYTVKTPDALDPTKPWILGLKFAATPDGSALPVDLYIGYDSSFAISGDAGTVSATGGAKYKQIMDDVVLAVSPLMYVWQMDPNLAVADVVTVAAIATGLKIKVPVAPYYAFNLNGASTLAATTATWVIIQ